MKNSFWYVKETGVTTNVSQNNDFAVKTGTSRGSRADDSKNKEDVFQKQVSEAKYYLSRPVTLGFHKSNQRTSRNNGPLVASRKIGIKSPWARLRVRENGRRRKNATRRGLFMNFIATLCTFSRASASWDSMGEGA